MLVFENKQNLDFHVILAEMNLPGVSKKEIKKCKDTEKGIFALEQSLTDPEMKAGMFLLLVIDYQLQEEACLDFITRTKILYSEVSPDLHPYIVVVSNGAVNPSKIKAIIDAGADAFLEKELNAKRLLQVF